MPGRSTALRWLSIHPKFRDRYALAREAQADYLLEQLLDIADDTEDDTYEDKDGRVRTNHEVVNRSRLRIDTRKWIIAKLAPKKYGDVKDTDCLLYTSPSPRDRQKSRMPSSA